MNTKFFTMKTDLFFPKKAYMTMLSILCSFALATSAFAQCVFTNCPSPPFVTQLDMDGDCLVDYPVNFTFSSCADGDVVNFTLISGPAIKAVTDPTYVAGEANVNSFSASIASNAAGFVFADLPLGIYDFRFTLSSNPDAICRYTLVVQETNNLACNDDINIALDGNCQANILVDMILEGEVSCYDQYTIEIEGYPAATYEVIVDAPGAYGVTITSPSGQSCWSSIVVEDKLSQPLFCNPVSLYCSQGYDPGTPILAYKAIPDPGQTFPAPSATVDAMVVDPTNTGGSTTTQGAYTGATGGAHNLFPVSGNAAANNDNGTAGDPSDDFVEPDTMSVNFDFSACPSTDIVQNVEVVLDVTVAQVNQVEVWLTNGTTTIQLLDLVSGNACVESDFYLELSDNGFFPHSAFSVPLYCGSGPNESYYGNFQPLNALSAFNNNTIQGVWQLLFVNHSQTNTITVEQAEINMSIGSGTVSYPLSGPGITWTQTGDDEYDVTISNNNCGPYSAKFTDTEDNACDIINGDLISKVVDREWVLTNGAGLTASCTQKIYIKRWQAADILFPPNYDGFDYPAFNCNDILDANGAFLPGVVDQNGNIAPSVTGMPVTPFGDIDLCGNYQFDYTDLKLPICGNSYKLLREWTLIDWCASGANGIRTETQVIKVVDTEAPVMICAPATTNPFGEPSFLQDSDPYTCTATWLVERPVLVSDCGVELTDYSFTIGYLLADSNGEAPVNGVYETSANITLGSDGNPMSISGLPVGRTWLQYSVSDDCNNIGTCRTEIYIHDDSDPFAVCLEHTVATLGPSGCVVVNAPSFDNGSWDNCGDVTFLARRAQNDSTLDNYSEQLEFCCADCGSTYEVDLLVTDLAGNTSSCTVDIDIIDNLPPIQNGLPAEIVEISCIDGPITLDEWRNRYINDFDYSDNCQSNFQYTLVDPSPELAEPNECGNNTFTYKWNISNDCGEDFTFNQTLTFINGTNPTVNSWPSDLLNLTECANSPTPDELNGYPSISDDACAQIAVSHDDQTFYDVDNACIKILRTWTVIDWCRYDANATNPIGISSHVQTIKIVDTELPVVTCPGSFTVEGFTEDCAVTTDHDNLILEAIDECTTEMAGLDLNISWEISANGSVVYSGTGNNANGNYAYGSYSIQWFVEDHCGNVNDMCVYTFNIVDAKKPTPYCRGTVVTATMQAGNAGVAIWASDFDLGGTDNYTGNCNSNPLNVFFLENGTQTTSLTFDCDDMPNGTEATIFVDVWYEDEAGNRDFCTVTVVLQDNENDACDNVGSRIQGNVRTEDHEMVENVTVEISSDQPEYPETMITAADGEYEFNDIPEGGDYVITSERSDNVLNGVSTLDIVLIQKHILGLLPLNSSYKIIAADANNSGSVSAIDLIEIRKVILGINQIYPNGQDSWRFVNSTQTWNNPNQPFPYDEDMNYTNFSTSYFGQDIVAVKIGDVNSTAVVNLVGENTVESRSESFSFAVENTALKAGTQVEIPVYADDFDNMIGYQFSLKAGSQIEIVDIVSNAMDLTESNFGWNNMDRGVITSSWHAAEATSYDNDEVLFTIIVEVNTDATVAEVLTINSEVTTAEAYTDNLDIKKVTLDFRNGETSGVLVDEFALYQNVPNPFDNSTEISFNLPVQSDITLTVYDVNGKLLKEVNGSYEAGTHSMTLISDDFNNYTGLMYYQLETDGFIQTKKMIHVK